MKYIILFCGIVCVVFGSENVFSEQQILLLEERFRKTPYKDVSVGDARRIVQYLITTETETYESLMDKFQEGKARGYTPNILRKFAQGQSYIQAVDYLKNYYDRTSTSLICRSTAPIIIEKHWYDPILNLFQRSDSESSSDSRKSDRSLGYLKKDLDNNPEKEPFIKKSKAEKKKD
ncbi:MAG: hypothetical protein KBD31_00290 [Proteobacteria bacterium]|nr:hypothetical protein [Pseudomonadota bacterium]